MTQIEGGETFDEIKKCCVNRPLVDRGSDYCNPCKILIGIL